MRLLAAAALLCLATIGMCQQTCRSATTQAGSRAGEPCAGTVYRTKLCGETEAAALNTAGFVGDFADSTLTPEGCRNDIVAPICRDIGPNGVAKASVGCDILCEVLGTGAATLCETDAECASGQTINMDILSEGIDNYIAGAISKMCCTYYEKKIREACDGLTDTEITTFMDAATDQTCSTLPTCLDPSTFSISARTHSWGVTALFGLGALSTLLALLLY